MSNKRYTLGEEIVNSITHGIAAGLSIAALVLLIVKAKTPLSIISVIIYGTIMFVLYIISCIYHALSSNIKGKKVLRILDHVNILLMVAGTYTPILLLLIKGYLGLILTLIIWIITIISVVLTSINLEKYLKINIFLNLLLGWGALFLIKLLINLVPINALILLIVGGVMYSIGAILYALGKKIKYMHSVFHIFVILGSIFHFFFIYLYCI